MKIKKIVQLSMLTAIMVVLSYIESLFPILNGIVPGFKLGIGNIIVIITLYLYSFKEAFYVSILRIFVISILKTGFSITFLFSFLGTILSISTMTIAKKTKLSIIGVSIVGAIFHNVGQIIIAVLILNINMIYYLPILLLLSLFTGTIIGIISKEIIPEIKNLI